LWLYRRLLAKRCIFHSTSDIETQYIKEQLPPGVEIIQIPNYVEIPPLAERTPKRYLLFVGRMKRKKAIENLIEALAISHRFSSSDLVLKIAGRGDEHYVEELKELTDRLKLSDRVEFIGQVEGHSKEKLYADAYWTFMPSHTENFGMVVLESLAQNTPVLASKGTPWEVLEQERVGIWADNSPGSLAENIDKIIAMPTDEYETYRSRGRAFVEKHFDIRSNIHRWNELYSSLGDK
jgi:glycosyltransferase involved in cell wall biosynthesis